MFVMVACILFVKVICGHSGDVGDDTEWDRGNGCWSKRLGKDPASLGELWNVNPFVPGLRKRPFGFLKIVLGDNYFLNSGVLPAIMLELKLESNSKQEKWLYLQVLKSRRELSGDWWHILRFVWLCWGYLLRSGLSPCSRWSLSSTRH